MNETARIVKEEVRWRDGGRLIWNIIIQSDLIIFCEIEFDAFLKLLKHT